MDYHYLVLDENEDGYYRAEENYDEEQRYLTRVTNTQADLIKLQNDTPLVDILTRKQLEDIVANTFIPPAKRR